MAECQLCAVEATTPIYHDGERCIVYECDTCATPMLTLREHTADPETTTEAYCMGIVRGLFGSGAAFADADHGTPESHWNYHIAVPTE
jgi:predicted nucleic acid-binding Zn ribbon protein